MYELSLLVQLKLMLVLKGKIVRYMRVVSCCRF